MRFGGQTVLVQIRDYLSDEKDKKTTEVKKAVLSTTKKAQKLLKEKLLREGKDPSGLEDVSMDAGETRRLVRNPDLRKDKMDVTNRS